MSSHFVPSHEHEELGRVVAASVTSSNAILIRNHGPMCFGRTLGEAKICCQVVEKFCQIYLQLLAAGDFRVISQENIKAGREYYLHSYGKS